MKSSRAAVWLLAAIAGVSLCARGYGVEPKQPPRIEALKAGTLVKAPAANWLTPGGNIFNQRYSSLTEINRQNVSKLRGVWEKHLDGSGIGPQYSGEAQPIVHDGVIYVVTGADDVFAVSVETGKTLWKYVAQLDPKIATAVCCGWASRGVAIGEGRVYVGQLDGKLVALDQATGKIAWSVQAERWQDGYTITGAPLYYDGLIITGFGGSARSSRGRVKAYDAKSGKPVWTFYTVPGPGEPGHDTWPADNDFWQYGGANVWMTPAVDPKLGLIYFGTSGPGSYFNGAPRAGDNLYANSVVAVEAKTGRYRWHFQAVHHDIWDYDMTNPVILFDATVDNEMRHGIAAAGKTGWVYILDRITGKPLIGIEERPVPQDARQKTAATQPYPIGDAFVPQEIDIAPEGYKLENGGKIFTPFWLDGALMKPAPRGGANWPPSSFDPTTNRMFICATDKAQYYTGGDRDGDPRGWRPGQFFVGSSTFHFIDQPEFGVFAALDVTTNRLVWQQRWNGACYSGSVATAGGLVFVGRNDGRMTALDSSDGKLLWEFQTGAGANAPATVFEYRGKQYVVSLSAGNLFAGTAKGDSLWLFSLDGKLEPVSAARQVADVGGAGNHGPQTVTIPVGLGEEDMRIAREDFTRVCSSCHGPAGEGTGYGASLKKASDAGKNARTISQGRGGMPSFSTMLSETEIGRLAAYVASLSFATASPPDPK
ncbi:PQQ-binding-like beta-propeller repeat protein [Rhizorhabdus dicambivorans]|nr:PQQ-binding-like beta-propeller repeat protein [Rhizorhabdus dicambivorans]